jgi:hypothetical protein
VTASLPTDELLELLRFRRIDKRNGGVGPSTVNLMGKAADEIERLRTIVRSVNRIVSQNEPYKWKVERIVAALGDSHADVPARHECVFSRTGGPVETHCVLCGAPSRNPPR